MHFLPRQTASSRTSRGRSGKVLNHLAVQRTVAASIQTQALNAIVFLYRDVLVAPLGEMNGLHRVQQRKRIPVVITASEVSRVTSPFDAL